MNSILDAANAMRSPRITLLLVVLGMFVGLQAAQADLVFDIENVSVVPGQLARVGVLVHATNGEQLYDYDLTIDVGANGFGLPAGLPGFLPGMMDDSCSGCLSSSDVIVSGFTKLPSPFIQNYEAIFSDNGLGGVDLASGPVRLFELLILTEPGLVGTVPIVITSQNVPNRLNVVSSLGTNSQATDDLLLLAGAITAVPEPSSFLAVGGVALVAACYGGWASLRRRSAVFLARFTSGSMVCRRFPRLLFRLSTSG